MKVLFEWFVSDILIWLIAGFAGWKFIDGIRESKIGQSVWALIIGGAAYYFVKNPVTVLNWIGNIFSKMFGGG